MNKQKHMVIELVNGEPKAVFYDEKPKKTNWIQDVQARFKLGDKVAAVTSALGIKPCDGCKERQAYLNGERSPDN